VVAAIIVGALTAWYLGLRLGVIIAVVTAAALVVASIIPGMSLTVYALVLAWSAALYFFGPKISKATGKTSMFGGVGGVMGKAGSGINQASSWAKKFLGRQTK
jgi:EamA domain-containing membrane protein RarD